MTREELTDNKKRAKILEKRIARLEKMFNEEFGNTETSDTKQVKKKSLVEMYRNR